MGAKLEFPTVISRAEVAVPPALSVAEDGVKVLLMVGTFGTTEQEPRSVRVVELMRVVLPVVVFTRERPVTLAMVELM